MSILAWIIVGGLSGALAKGATGYKRNSGCLFSIAVGIIGALIGGAIFSALGSTGVDSFNLWSVLVSFVGAVVLLLVLQLLSPKGT